MDHEHRPAREPGERGIDDEREADSGGCDEMVAAHAANITGRSAGRFRKPRTSLRFVNLRGHEPRFTSERLRRPISAVATSSVAMQSRLHAGRAELAGGAVNPPARGSRDPQSHGHEQDVDAKPDRQHDQERACHDSTSRIPFETNAGRGREFRLCGGGSRSSLPKFSSSTSRANRVRHEAARLTA